MEQYLDKTLSFEERAKDLVSRMTLDEKASQLTYHSAAVERLGIPAYNWWNEALHGVARAGTATVFPQAIGLAAMFDREQMHKVGEVISTEGRAKYNAYTSEEDRDIYKGAHFLESQRQYLPGSPLGARPGNLWRGSLSHRQAGRGIYRGHSGR